MNILKKYIEKFNAQKNLEEEEVREIKASSPVEPMESTAPEVIKEAAIKQTTCRACHTVYRCEFHHLKAGYNPYEFVSRCPRCHTINKIEFEGSEESEGEALTLI